MIAIIDYGMGNIHSVKKALEVLGAQTQVVSRPSGLKKCGKIVFPGVGAFDDAVLELEKQGLITALIESIKNKKIFLGICLGMQLLFEESREAEIKKGLGVLKGTVEKFEGRSPTGPAARLKVPHMGWNQLNIKQKHCPLLNNIADKAYVYFCHSYYPKPIDGKVTAATTDYGIEFSSIVWQENVYGVQFHPEKSQDTGLKILKNFVEL